MQEVATFPPSVAEVSTAVPAFIGYTEQELHDGESLVGKPVRITSFLEYQTIFGGAQSSNYSLTVGDTNDPAGSLTANGGTMTDRTLYYQLDMYFKNGGGACYVVSTGTYGAPLSVDSFNAALAALKGEDEPTLYVFADALLLGPDNYYSVAGQALKDCETLGDRFSIIDMLHGTSSEDFRTKLSVPASQLKYGAAYTPYLHTALAHTFDESQVTISGLGDAAVPQSGTYTTGPNGLSVTYHGPEADGAKVSITSTGEATSVSISGNHLTIFVNGGEVGVSTVLNKWDALSDSNKALFSLAQVGDGSAKVTAGVVGSPFSYNAGEGANSTLSQIKTDNTAVYNAAMKMLQKQRVTLPPSPVMAGVYATTDRTRGVWKAPANIALTSVLAPVTKITNAEQEDLNVDATSGKSINAIRSFTGQGTVVWGARTLLGNDNEWRYISVRRLFNTVEESTQKATAFAVFEPNDATTWLKVKGMIESYLFGLYEQGAFAGSTPESAYYVNVGLGTTMTAQDILEGRMVVEIGLAAVRPAEFIVLKFSHKLQEA